MTKNYLINWRKRHSVISKKDDLKRKIILFHKESNEKIKELGINPLTLDVNSIEYSRALRAYMVWCNNRVEELGIPHPCNE